MFLKIFKISHSRISMHTIANTFNIFSLLTYVDDNAKHNKLLLKSSLAVNGDFNFATKAKPINDIDGKSHKMELKSGSNYSINHIKLKSCH